MPLVMPMLLIKAMRPVRASGDRLAVGIAQKIGIAANSRTVAVDSSASAVARLAGCVVNDTRAIAPPVAQREMPGMARFAVSLARNHDAPHRADRIRDHRVNL
jgi:hypothetical protein